MKAGDWINGDIHLFSARPLVNVYRQEIERGCIPISREKATIPSFSLFPPEAHQTVQIRYIKHENTIPLSKSEQYKQ